MPRNNTQRRRAKRLRNARGTGSSEEHAVGALVQGHVAVKGPVRPMKELKFIDTGFTSVLDTTGAVTLINGIGEGDDYTNRNSRSVVIRSVSIRASAQPTVTTGLPQKCRVMLVWDNAANGAALTIAQVLATASPYAYPLVDNEKRFTIVYDNTFAIGLQAAAIADQVIVSFDDTFQMNAPMIFQGTGATVASIQNGSLYCLTIGNNVAGTTAGLATIQTRVRYMENDSN